MLSLFGFCWPSKPKLLQEEELGNVSPGLQKPERRTPSKGDMAADAVLVTLNIVAETIPLPAVGTAVKAAIRLIEMCQQVRASLEQADELRERIRGLSLVLVQGLSGKPLEQITDNLKRDIELLQTDLQYIEEKLKDISKQHRFLLVLFKDANEEAVKKCLRKLDGSLSNFELARQVQNATDLKKLENDIEAYNNTLGTTCKNTEEIKEILLNFNPEFRQEIKQNSRKPHFPPRSHIFYGRDDLVSSLTTKLEPSSDQMVLVALLGPGGIGKTSAALAVMEHGQIQKWYGVNRFWVPCENATDVTLLLDILYNSLCINKKTGQTLDDILAELEPPSGVPNQQPYRVLLLDNFETPWNTVHVDDQKKVEDILRALADIPRLSILMTMRANQPPTDQKWVTQKLEPIMPDASARIYTDIYPQTSRKELPVLLSTIGHLPLAITLLANYAKTNGATPARLLRDWLRKGPDILSTLDDGTDNKIHRSIRLSMEKPPVIGSTPAKELLTLLAFFPAPVLLADLEHHWAPASLDQLKAISVLSRTALVELRDSTVFVIPVIRSYILRFPPANLAATRTRIHQVCCSLLADHGSSPGDSNYLADKEFISTHEVHLQSILLDATSESTNDVSPETLKALLILGWHQCYTRPRFDLIEHTLSISKNAKNTKYEAESQACYAEICMALNQFDHAIERISLAHSQFITLEDMLSAARCTIKLIEYKMYEQASLEELLSLARQAQTEYGADAFGQAVCTLTIGSVYRFWGMGSEALLHLKQARVKFEESGNQLELERCLQYLSRTYLWFRPLPDSLSIALDLANQALELSEKCGRGEYISQDLHTLAQCLKESGSYDLALNRALEFLEMAKSLGDPGGVAQAFCETGDILFRRGDYTEARDALQKSLAALGGIPTSSWKDLGEKHCRTLLDQIDRRLRDGDRESTMDHDTDDDDGDANSQD